MANLRTTTDILQDALFHANEPMNSSSDYYSQALVYLNRTYQSLCSGGSELDPDVDENWWWLRSPQPGVLTLQPSFNTASVSVTNGLTAIIYSAVPKNPQGGNISVQGQFFSVSSDNGDVYRIASHASGSLMATLDSPYTGITSAAIAQKTFQLQYPLAANVKSIIGCMRQFQQDPYDINYSDVDPMRRQFPLASMPVRAPILYAMVQEQTVEFSHYPGDDPTDQMRVEYDYLILPIDLVDDAGQSAPIVPYEYNQLLSDWTAGIVLTDKDDNRNVAFLASAKSKLKAMAFEHRRRIAKTGNFTGKIMPRQNDVRRVDSPIRTQSGLIIG